MIEILGFIAALFTTFSSVPQIVKMAKTKSTGDVSMYMYIFLFIGCILWLTYGLLLGSYPLIIANIFSLSLTSMSIYYKLRYNN